MQADQWICRDFLQALDPQEIGTDRDKNCSVQARISFDNASMNSSETEIERRKEKRYKVASGAYAVIGNKPNKLGQINNISSSGLAFKYLANEASSNGAQVMDVFVRNHPFHMKDIPIKTVYDVELAKENPCSTVLLRQQSVMFGNLTEEQTSGIMHLLQHHTLGEI
jgi:hypothetical protein